MPTFTSFSADVPHEKEILRIKVMPDLKELCRTHDFELVMKDLCSEHLPAEFHDVHGREQLHMELIREAKQTSEAVLLLVSGEGNAKVEIFNNASSCSSIILFANREHAIFLSEDHNFVLLSFLGSIVSRVIPGSKMNYYNGSQFCTAVC